MIAGCNEYLLVKEGEFKLKNPPCRFRDSPLYKGGAVRT